MAVGMGFDIHRLTAGRPLRLGGVEIPHSAGLEGHSDGDAVLHAVIDALLGAAGLGDIGQKFPDTDPAWKGASSRDLLAKVAGEVAAKWSVVNVDVTILAEAPKIAPHRDAMAAAVSGALGGAPVSIKAKTMEGLGPIGAKEAIAAYAVAELTPRAKK